MSLRLGPKPAAVGVLVSAASIAVVTALIYVLREVMPVSAAGSLYLLPVLLASIYWGLALGIGTSIAGALAFNFFHIPPTGRFTIGEEQNWVALAVFLVAAVVTSTLAGAARARAEEAELRRGEADLNAEMARVLLGGTELEESLRLVGQRIAQALELPWVEVEAAWTSSDERRRALPVVVEGVRAGTVAVPRDAPFLAVESIERRVIPSLETLLTAARKRDGLEAQVIETRALRRSNVVKTALLRSVSHDLRSPLTAITAAAAGLRSPTLDEEARAELVSVVATESERLTRLVDNLLDLSRLQAGQLEPRADWSSAEELIEAAATTADAAAGRLRGLDRGGASDVRGRCGADRAGAGERGRERRSLRRRRAGHDQRPADGRRRGDQGLRSRPGIPRGRARADLRPVPRGRRARRWVRARPRDRARLRRGERRHAAGAVAARAGRDVHDPAAPEGAQSPAAAQAAVERG